MFVADRSKNCKLGRPLIASPRGFIASGEIFMFEIVRVVNFLIFMQFF